MIEEAGDILWYLNLGYHAIGENLHDQPVVRDINFIWHAGVRESIIRLSVRSSRLMDKCKRAIYYGKGKKELGQTSLKLMFNNVLFSTHCLLKSIGSNIQEAMDKNYRKLYKRYKDGKFTSECANIRDLDAERLELEN